MTTVRVYHLAPTSRVLADFAPNVKAAATAVRAE
jgi:hypothetical protein